MLVSRASQNTGGERRDLRIPRGIVIVRYAASKGGRAAPSLVLTVPRGSGAELIDLTERAEQTLAKPGAATVVRAQRDTTISLEVVPSQIGGSLDAEVHIERMTAAITQPDDRRPPAAPVVVSSDAIADLQVLAHVSRRGDILVGSGEWICGPQVPMSIEGIEIRLGRLAPDLDIMVSGSARSKLPVNFPVSSSGTFIGSRGRAAPLTTLTFSLIGRAASAFQLSVDALFLAAPVVSRLGNSIELSGPTGNEPLVGLRLALRAIGQSGVQVPSIRPVAVPPPKLVTGGANQGDVSGTIAAGSAGRVRVFRASRLRGN
ncbi:hypothetical protein [Phreatobacter stygius]|uniref:Uncharacterized protein n=1 Tax=Phreatobacter stygius TaxID=1940610 RepID=A0A4D7BE17_9HYPH|nr:hypothetical protein [Phreatobacter stygius]QCI66232.1 hypothetical protein E8M01_19645 [Phreatobacter stygius]